MTRRLRGMSKKKNDLKAGVLMIRSRISIKLQLDMH